MPSHQSYSRQDPASIPRLTATAGRLTFLCLTASRSAGAMKGVRRPLVKETARWSFHLVDKKWRPIPGVIAGEVGWHGRGVPPAHTCSCYTLHTLILKPLYTLEKGLAQPKLGAMLPWLPPPDWLVVEY